MTHKGYKIERDINGWLATRKGGFKFASTLQQLFNLIDKK